MFHKMEKMEEAIRQNNAGQIKRIGSIEKYAEACTLAIESNAPDALKALLEKNKGFFLTRGDKYADANAARKLVNAAFISSNPLPLLSVLYEANKTTKFGKLETQDFVTMDTPVELLQTILKENPSLYRACMKAAGVRSTEKLEAILAFTPDTAEAQPTLDETLRLVVEQTRNVERAKILLEHHANPNCNDGEVLLRAGWNGHREMVDLLLPQMNAGLRHVIAAKLELSPDVDAGLINAIEPASMKKPSAAPQSAREIDGFIREGDDAISKTQTLADGMRIKNLFNFLVREKQTIVETPGCSMPGVSTTPFGQLEDGVVKKMEKIHAALSEKEKPAVARPSTRLRVLQ